MLTRLTRTVALLAAVVGVTATSCGSDGERGPAGAPGGVGQPGTPGGKGDPSGAIFAMQESDPDDPGASATFEFFEVWHGTVGGGDFDAASPDNIVIDADGGVWLAPTATSAPTTGPTRSTTSISTRPTRAGCGGGQSELRKGVPQGCEAELRSDPLDLLLGQRPQELHRRQRLLATELLSLRLARATLR